MINTFLKIYFTIGLVIFILNIVSICIAASFDQKLLDKFNNSNDFVRCTKFKTIKEAFFGVINCILFSFILWPVFVIVDIAGVINFFNKRR